jgi:glycosyltransferase involved in cell wall biosynthesis
MQNERYKKVLDSITAQNYTNYQIVFIDDFSSDATLASTK